MKKQRKRTRVLVGYRVKIELESARDTIELELDDDIEACVDEHVLNNMVRHFHDVEEIYEDED